VVVGLKAGASRLRGHVCLERLSMSQVLAANDWINRQESPRSGVLECVLLGRDEESVFLSLLFEQSIGGPAWNDDLLEDARKYQHAWQERTEVSERSHGAPSHLPGDPRDLAPVNAWLLKGKRASYPTESELGRDARAGDAGVFDSLWTVAKQTEVGDLALVYFLKPDSAVHFVARTASRAFFDRETIPDEGVSSAQWWAYLTPFIQIEPVPLATLRDLAHGHLLLHGGSGLYLRPDLIEGPAVKAKRPEDEEALAHIWRVPVGRADLPRPEDLTMDQWRTLASGAMKLEANVSQYVVEPLLRSSLEGTHLTWRPEYPVAKKSADYVVLDGDRPLCVVEVKLAVRESPDGVWEHSKDFAQMRGYAGSLQCRGILIDANRVVLVAEGSEKPFRIIDRRQATDQDLDAIRQHLTGVR
jgi:hypothetical protein